MKSLAEQWATYRERVVPEDAPPVQVVESRRAFYAGTESLLRSMMTGLDPGTEPTEADLDRMDQLEAELEQFAEDVKQGLA
jgi:dsDNA-specific endonuclease/ATPase MutS2